MRFFETVLSGAALFAVALGLTIDTYPSGGVVAGQTYTITYSPKDNTPTTFILRQGPSGNLNTIDTLTTTATGGSFQWTVPKSLPNQPNYAFEIRQGSTTNFSGQFGLTGGSAAVSSAVSSAQASASSAVASAASSASAALSSALSSIRASASATASGNSTVSSATLSAGPTSHASSKPTSTASGSSGPPASTGAASALNGSPMAAVAGLFAAFAYLA